MLQEDMKVVIMAAGEGTRMRSSLPKVLHQAAGKCLVEWVADAARAVTEKPVLIFDEPTSGLDYARMVEVSGVIRDLARQGRIVLVVTHDQEFLQQACDRVLHL